MKISLNFTKLQKQVVFCLLSLISGSLYAHEPQTIEGKFVWANSLKVVEIHNWETGEWNSVDGQNRKKELTQNGFSCYRKNPKIFSCHQLVAGNDDDLTEDLKVSIDKFIRNYKITFEGPFAKPKEMIRTSTEHEWWIQGIVKINNVKVEGFKWTYQFEPHADLVVLPVNEEQPIPWFVFTNENTLQLPLQVEQKSGPNKQKLFLLEAQFSKVLL